MSRLQGDAMFFPAYSLHKVDPIESGARVSLVAWAVWMRTSMPCCSMNSKVPSSPEASAPRAQMGVDNSTWWDKQIETYRALAAQEVDDGKAAKVAELEAMKFSVLRKRAVAAVRCITDLCISTK